MNCQDQLDRLWVKFVKDFYESLKIADEKEIDEIKSYLIITGRNTGVKGVTFLNLINNHKDKN